METNSTNVQNTQPKKLVMSSSDSTKIEAADSPHIFRSIFSIIFVTVFLLGAFVSAFLLKGYLHY